jgi:hypothetical protein
MSNKTAAIPANHKSAIVYPPIDFELRLYFIAESRKDAAKRMLYCVKKV